MSNLDLVGAGFRPVGRDMDGPPLLTKRDSSITLLTVLVNSHGMLNMFSIDVYLLLELK